jgi:quercetin dioxygenase-like cupin family protein
MHIRKYRWSKHYESAEEELVQLLAVKQISATRWTAEGGEAIGPRTCSADITIWCAEGTIVFIIASKQYSLQPGDTLELPAGTVYEATGGLFGCACYEAPTKKQTQSE